MDNLEVVNELHHPNDYCRLYNIALLASVNDEELPYDEMKEEFDNAINERQLNIERFNSAYPQYIQTLEIAYGVIDRLRRNHIEIPNKFRF